MPGVRGEVGTLVDRLSEKCRGWKVRVGGE